MGINIIYSGPLGSTDNEVFLLKNGDIYLRIAPCTRSHLFQSIVRSVVDGNKNK
jgi:hypothetical protein